jgi:hypothetical protein
VPKYARVYIRNKKIMVWYESGIWKIQNNLVSL